MEISQVVTNRTIRTRRVLVSHAVKIKGALNGGPIEKEIRPILEKVGRILDLNGTTADQVARFIRVSQDAIFLNNGGLKVSISAQATELTIVICSTDERPNRLPTWSSALQEQAAKLSNEIAAALRG